VDAWVSSTDKNFMVPVGGALVGSPDASFLSAVSALYPGRASVAPILDLFITLLQMGASGLRQLLQQRSACFSALQAALAACAAEQGERLLHTPHNPISLAITVSRMARAQALEEAEQAEQAQQAQAESLSAATTYLGSMLFSRGISGARVVTGTASAVMGGCSFSGFGAQCNAYPPGAYLTAAAAIGLPLQEVAVLQERLSRALKDYSRQRRAAVAAAAAAAAGGSAAAAEQLSDSRGSGLSSAAAAALAAAAAAAVGGGAGGEEQAAAEQEEEEEEQQRQ
jgi:O-phospho-L-seryl-tRNASec:L-selenocysteinyl-tRNA synthase